MCICISIFFSRPCLFYQSKKCKIQVSIPNNIILSNSLFCSLYKLKIKNFLSTKMNLILKITNMLNCMNIEENKKIFLSWYPSLQPCLWNSSIELIFNSQMQTSKFSQKEILLILLIFMCNLKNSHFLTFWHLICNWLGAKF